MSESISKTTTAGADVRRELIDPDSHPDGLLLCMCACLGRTRNALVQLEDAIASTPALTVDGRRMKELTL